MNDKTNFTFEEKIRTAIIDIILIRILRMIYG